MRPDRRHEETSANGPDGSSWSVPADLVAEAGLTRTGGSHALRGVGDDWRLYAIAG
jgi:hypothetical protein